MRTFEPKGRISAHAACEEIIQRIEPREGITYAQALDDVEELCEFRHTRATVVSAMASAAEALLAQGVKGVTSSRAGWVRMDDGAAVDYARERGRRAARQIRRSGRGAAAADPSALSWEDRQSRDHYIRAADQAKALQERRARRLRPLPPPETATA